MFTMTDRIEKLAERNREVFEERWGNSPADENYREAFDGLYGEEDLARRQALSFAYALTHEPVTVFADERFHGTFFTYPSLCSQLPEYHHGVQIQRRCDEEIPLLAEVAGTSETQHDVDGDGQALIMTYGTAPGHIAWNYQWILERGVNGLMAECQSRAAQCDDAEQKQYYEATLIELEAVLEWNRRHIVELEKLAKGCGDAVQRERLEQSIAIMKRVPAEPARNFIEALHSFYFQYLCVMYEAPAGGNGPGRLDYFLWPYLQKDLEAGRLDEQQAGELIAELFIKMDQRIFGHDGHVETIVIGGVTPEGKDGVTPLTYLMLDVFEKLNITHPALYARISQVNDERYFDRCVDYLLASGNRAQILNDDAIIKAMQRDERMQAEDAAMYMCGGCMEIAPHGMNSDLLFSFLISVPKILELFMTGGVCLITGKQRMTVEGSLGDFDNFEDFYQGFEVFLRQICHLKFRHLDITSQTWAKLRPYYLQSAMVSDCLENGKNLHAGGARYHDYGGSPIGIQNAADSLYAIKRAVFEERVCSAEELLETLADDFADNPTLHAYLKKLPKYGQGHDEADRMMRRLVQSISRIFDTYTNWLGGRVKQVILTFVFAPWVGRNIGASPDGRRSQTPVGHGVTPQSAAMTEGITAAMGSYCSLDNTLFTGGASTMWDMDAGWINHELMGSILRSFLNQGGQIFQGNTTDVGHLKQAMERPEEYGHLVVRVGGFSARFVSLDKAVQREIIERYRHCG